jgi:hypothetical protein
VRWRTWYNEVHELHLSPKMEDEVKEGTLYGVCSIMEVFRILYFLGGAKHMCKLIHMNHKYKG